MLHLTVEAAPDYTVTTTGNAVVVTDLSGNGDTLAVSEPSAGNIQFTAAGRSFSVNDGLQIAGDSGAVSLTSVTGITVNAGAGVDIIHLGAFTGALPNLTLNGGIGDDTVNLNGDITFAADASLEVDLQNDDVTPGVDSVSVATGANLVTSGTGSITVKVSRNVALAAGSSLDIKRDTPFLCRMQLMFHQKKKWGLDSIQSSSQTSKAPSWRSFCRSSRCL